MTQEEKQKLCIALCGYFPHGVKCNINGNLCKIEWIDIEHQQFYLKKDDEHGGTYSIARGDVIKPYLRPMSSMTEEEKIELCIRAYAPDEMKTIDEKLYVIQTNAKNATDFYNEHHIDYRGLIPMGLGIDCTGLNIY